MRNLLIFLSVGIATLLYSCNDDVTMEDMQCMSKGKGEISYLASNYTAGDKVKFKLETSNLLDEDIIVVWDSKFGEQYFNKTVFSESSFFTFPDSISIYSGLVTIKVIHCNKILCQDKIYIKSQHPTGTIESYLGPKTLAIDQNLHSMLCLIPSDKYGNCLLYTSPSPRDRG